MIKAIILLLTIASPAYAFTWPHGATTAVSITADDGWPTQLTQADILESHGMRGTFYLTALRPAYASSWAARSRKGHEIGNHTYRHEVGYGWRRIARSVGNMEWWLQTRIGKKPHTFAYPQGREYVGPAYNKQYLRVGTCEYFALLSAAVPGARRLTYQDNDPGSIWANRYRINSYPIYGARSVSTAFNAIDTGLANGSWVVLSFHSLGEGGDNYYVTRSEYEQIIDYIDDPDIWVAPVVEILQYIKDNTPEQPWTCVGTP